MPSTTSRDIKSNDKAYSKAWDEKPKAMQPCKGCKTPGYCSEQGCQAKEADMLKKVGA